jgi:hypothetical protein
MVLDNETILKLLGVMIASGFGVSLVAQFLKKNLGLKTSNTVMHTLVVALACVAAFAQYFEQIHSQLAPTILGISSATIYGVSQMVFKYASYGTSFVNKINSYNQAQNATASLSDSQTSYTTQVFSAPSTTSVYPTQSEQPQGFEL